MSITPNGVTFEKKQRSRMILVGAIVLEAIFTFLLYFSMAARIFAPDPVRSAAGVPQQMSYQGRLTDSSGNPLGGTGTTYCFRYSLYDAQSGGSKVWPSGTPTNSTTTVVDGVFSDQIGRVDSLTYDFVSTSTLYLNVDVNTTTSTCGGSWESLSPRQQILASGFSLASQSVYGSGLRVPTSTKVQIGTGAGAVTGQTLLSLDIRSSAETIGSACTDNGSLWYNSNLTTALLCENGAITQISNPTSTITGIKEQSAGSAIAAGTVNFSASTNITINQNGSTLQFSVADQPTLSQFVPFMASISATGLYSNAVMSLVPFTLPQRLSATRAAFMASVAPQTSTNNTLGGTLSISMGIFTRNVSSLSLASSGSGSYSFSNTSNASSSWLNGMRRFTIPFTINATPGDYWYGLWIRSSNSGGLSWGMSIMGAVPLATNAAYSGNFWVAANSSHQQVPGQGIFSNASFSTAMPSGIAISNIKGAVVNSGSRLPWVLFTGFDLN